MEKNVKAEGKPVILIAEDDDYSFFYLKEILNVTSIEVIRVINGADAVEICRRNSAIVLVLMDLKMPIMDGYKATRLIKQIRPKLPVIAQTAYAMSGDEAKAREAGCDDYISKPIDIKKMESLINKHSLSEKLKLAV